MRGYWHIVAFSVVLALVFQLTQYYLILLIYLLWLLALYLTNRCPLSVVIVAVALFVLLNIMNIDRVSNDEQEYPSINSKKLSGKIVSEVEMTSKLVRFNVESSDSRLPIQVTYFPETPEELRNESFEQLKHGANCSIEGKYEQIEQATNPGQFDFNEYLKKQGINGQFLISSIHNVACTGSSKFQILYETRQKLLAGATDQIKPNTSMWLKALIIGDKTDLPDETVKVFERWGLSHILAISGLHVGLLIGIIYLILVKSNLLTKENAEWFLIVFLPIYAVIAGGAPSVWRSSLMAFIVLILAKLNVKLIATDIVSIVLIVLLVLEPNMIMQIGFQFSFLVSGALIISRKWIMEGSSPLIQLFRISFLSQMVIVPIQVLYFYQVQPLSILLNVFVVPYFSIFVIPLLFMMLLFIWIPNPILSVIEVVFIHIHEPFLKILGVIDQTFHMPIYPGELSTLTILLYYILFYLLMLFLQLKKRPLAFLSGCMLIILLVGLALRPYISSVGSVTMLDIGQGDAFVVELPYRKGVIFIDAGSTFSFHDMKPSERVYKSVIAPYLHSKGIEKIDAVFLSHEHVDHDGSLLFMLKDFKIDTVIISPIYKPINEMQEAWKEHSTRVHFMKSGEQVNIKGQSLIALAPLIETNSANENSLVLYTKFGDKGFMFTGDIGVETERQIMNMYPSLTVDVLKVGHHGSNTSTSASFLEHYQPKYGLISAGRRNSFGHPTKNVIDTLIENEVNIFRTDKQGAVQYKYTEEGGTFYPFLP